MSDRLPDFVPPDFPCTFADASRITGHPREIIAAAVDSGALKSHFAFRVVTAIRGSDLSSWLTLAGLNPSRATALANDDEAYALMDAAAKAGVTRQVLTQALDARAIRHVRVHRPLRSSWRATWPSGLIARSARRPSQPPRNMRTWSRSR